jgi:hypothetical protein
LEVKVSGIEGCLGLKDVRMKRCLGFKHIRIEESTGKRMLRQFADERSLSVATTTRKRRR